MVKPYEKKSIEQRLYEAFRLSAGLKLDHVEVFMLLQDNAVAVRITNQACIEAGIEEIGHDCVNRNLERPTPTWEEWKAELKADSQ